MSELSDAVRRRVNRLVYGKREAEAKRPAALKAAA